MKTYEEVAKCGACGYPLRGLTERRCPECGRPFDPQDPSTFQHPFRDPPVGVIVRMARAGNILVAVGGTCFGLLGSVADTSGVEQRMAFLAGLSVMAAGALNYALLYCRRHSSTWWFRLGIGGANAYLVWVVAYGLYARWKLFGGLVADIDTFLVPVIVGLTLVAAFREARSRMS